MRSSIQLVINGQPRTVDGKDAFLTLSAYLRESLGLIGTKIVCSEGDCGACSVLMGRLQEDGKLLRYKAIDSCIAFLYQLDQTHILTIEGLGDENNLSPVQEAMVRCHGSQCGYCTPGFVTTMHGIYEDEQTSNERNGRESFVHEDDLRIGLSGNLCRCTGYVQIIRAAQSISITNVPALNTSYPPAPMIDLFEALGKESVSIHANERTVFVPKSLDDAIGIFAKHPTARLVSGATDIGVQHNHGRSSDATLICLSDIRELAGIEIGDDSVRIGAGATWTDVLNSTQHIFVEFADVLRRFGSPQIRNFGSLGGNLANASPIADSIPFLYASGARLELLSHRGSRLVPIEAFYLGYKRTDLQPGELIRAVHVPRLKESETLKLYKVSRRRDMDISTFTAAIRVTFAGNQVTDARIALGGVGPTVIRLNQTEKFLTCREFDFESMRQAGSLARTEITPITDVRGSSDYRLQLAENVLTKFFHDVSHPPQTVTT